ncbi:hypothetical protein CE91St58_62930 [Lachnospiraceae bacterium]|nr:hypothetical protein CE91St58_62930 [Lachnospiraceae bacterium]
MGIDSLSKSKAMFSVKKLKYLKKNNNPVQIIIERARIVFRYILSFRRASIIKAAI